MFGDERKREFIWRGAFVELWSHERKIRTSCSFSASHAWGENAIRWAFLPPWGSRRGKPTMEKK